VESYRSLKKFIDLSQDDYKEDLMNILFPVFVHVFLGMVRNKFLAEARQFFHEEKGQFVSLNRERVNELEQVDQVSSLSSPDVAKYLNNKFQVKMSRYAQELLKDNVKQNHHIIVMQILNQHITFETANEKNVLALKGIQSYLVSDDVSEINKEELQLSMLP